MERTDLYNSLFFKSDTCRVSFPTPVDLSSHLHKLRIYIFLYTLSFIFTHFFTNSKNKKKSTKKEFYEWRFTDLYFWSFFFSFPSLYRRPGSYPESFFRSLMTSYSPERYLLFLSRRWWVAEASRRRRRNTLLLFLKLSPESSAPWCWMLFRKGIVRGLGPARKLTMSRLRTVLCRVFCPNSYFFFVL